MRLNNRKVLAVALPAILVTACAGTEPLSPFDGTGQVWPSEPEPARIEFVAEFSGPDDLGISPSFWSRVKGLAVGAADQEMARPMAVAVSGDTKTVFVADPGTQCVHRFDLARGRYDRLFGERGEPLASPVGLTVAADGRIFVTDSAADVVYVAEPGDKQLRRIMLSPPPKQPTGVAFDDVSGHLFVSSTGSHMVRRYDATGTLLKDYGGRGEAAGEMNFPTYIWFEPPGELLVTDTMNFRIQRIDVEDGVLVNFGKAGDATGSLSRPKGVAVNRHGHIFVVDGGHHAMQVFDRNGQLLLAVGEQGQGAGQFWLPSGVFATADDLIFVADAFNGRVQVFRYLGDGL